jgi:hypothetical protein
MQRPGKLISLLPIPALIPRLGLVMIASDRQVVAADTREALLWVSSSALALLAGLAELYIGWAVVSRRHGGLGALWVVLTVLLNALIVPLSVSGLEAVPVWEILHSRALQVAWGAGLGLLSTVCVCGCLWADVLREGTEEGGQERHAPLSELSALPGLAAEAGSVAGPVQAALPQHSGCAYCGFWDADQRRVAGHIRQCRRKASAAEALSAEGSESVAALSVEAAPLGAAEERAYETR